MENEELDNAIQEWINVPQYNIDRIDAMVRSMMLTPQGLLPSFSVSYIRRRRMLPPKTKFKYGK